MTQSHRCRTRRAGKLILGAMLLASCSSSRHVPQGQYLLDKVSITAIDSTGREHEREELNVYLRQMPNHKMLWSMKFRLGVYNMSGNDTTRWYNRWIRKLGEPPVIYDSTLTEAGAEQLRKMMVNQGYLSAEVEVDTLVDSMKRKMRVDYRLHPGKAHTIASVTYDIPDPEIRAFVMSDSAALPVRPGIALDRNLLDTQRDIITTALNNRGYYAFTKDLITFNADTTAGSLLTDLTMKVEAPHERTEGQRIYFDSHRKYIVRRVVFVTDYDPTEAVALNRLQANDTIDYRDITVLYGKNHYLRPSVLYDNCFIRSGQFYNQRGVNRTYQALSRFNILKFVNIRFIPVGDPSETGLIDAYVLLTPGKSQSVALELEGTNSEGDLGVAASVTYTHRNIGHGSETLNFKLRGSYESLSGNLDGLLHDRYMEYSVDLGVNFPKFKAPLLKEKFKRRINATTELNMSLNYQERPEYTRIISTAGWSYKWTERVTHNRHTYTPIDINYVYLPESTYDFLDQIAPDNPLLRYSYEDHFIMRMGYSFYHTNKRNNTGTGIQPKSNIYTIRVNTEVAGNLLFALNSIFTHRSNFHEVPYKIFGIHYSQYFKAEADYALVHAYNTRNSLAFHTGAGVGVPYGNSTILPFEKRFYGGGANGVRGWDVRTLGPGRYPGSNSVSDFINQCGDIRLEASVEYRAKLFWVLELGAFIDAGNIWTIRDYANQPDGQFKFNSFYKEFALAYGLGLRMDFNYFLLRFDLGMKARNPALGAVEWPLIHPDWHRDSSFHFSIGYPF
ncbi:MAG: BamA/TamA family outer membrane protein [Muribaculaceae bacterium]|nr:BamA/TamA family outer membrane protein [Muribaculaceae bacterium]